MTTNFLDKERKGKIMRVDYTTLKETVKKTLINAGLKEEDAEICAKVHCDSSADGIESHGLNRIPRFIDYINKKWVNPEAKIELIAAKGAVENYNGHIGIGITNAIYCSDRAVELAKIHGIGVVTLKNTTHWMRGGTYAWRMAEAGFMGINWTNTESCMPMWGSDEPSVGNNPFCMAIPRENGPIVLDMAMSQYAYGKLGVYRLNEKKLPYPGGFDKDGNLTTDPGAIEESMRILPTGYWKGSGLAIVLDLAAAMMSNGKSGLDLDMENRGSCTGCSQVFIAYDPYLFGSKEEIQKMLDDRVEAADNANPIKTSSPVRCPGEGTMNTRKISMEKGINVDEKIWEQVKAIASGNLNIIDISSK